MAFALITRDLTEILRERRDVVPIPKAQLSLSKPYWVPIVHEVDDTSTGTVRKIMSGITETIEVDRVLRERTVRDITLDELTAEDDDQVESSFEEAGIIRALARVVFDQENRLRDLEGRSSITATQFKTALKNLMR